MSRPQPHELHARMHIRRRIVLPHEDMELVVELPYTSPIASTYDAALDERMYHWARYHGLDYPRLAAFRAFLGGAATVPSACEDGLQLLAKWYTFLFAHDDICVDHANVDVTQLLARVERYILLIGDPGLRPGVADDPLVRMLDDTLAHVRRTGLASGEFLQSLLDYARAGLHELALRGQSLDEATYWRLRPISGAVVSSFEVAFLACRITLSSRWREHEGFLRMREAALRHICVLNDMLSLPKEVEYEHNGNFAVIYRRIHALSCYAEVFERLTREILNPALEELERAGAELLAAAARGDLDDELDPDPRARQSISLAWSLIQLFRHWVAGHLRWEQGSARHQQIPACPVAVQDEPSSRNRKEPKPMPDTTRSAPTRLAPSATRIPVIGGIPALMRHNLAFLSQARERVGDIYRLELGLLSMTMLNRPEHIQHVFIDNASNYRKEGAMWAALRNIFGNSLPVAEGEIWRRQRRMMQPHFHQRELAVLCDLMVDAIDECVDRWPRPNAPGEVFDVAAASIPIAIKVGVRTLFGSAVDFATLDRLGGDLQAMVERVPVDMLTHVLPSWVPVPGRRRAHDARAAVRDTVERIITEVRARGPGHDLVSMLVRATDDGTGEGMTLQQLRDEAVTLFMVGYDTTAIGLGWAIHHLSRAPDVCARAVAEVASVVGDRRPTFGDLERLDYLTMVIKETLRLRPPAWFISRVAAASDVIDGVRIPAGTEVACSMYGVHHNPDIWPEPERFDPERFGSEQASGRHRLAWVPFGAGQRQCIGYQFAMMELKLALVAILRRYALGAVPGRVELELTNAMRAKGGLWVQLGRPS